MDTEIVTVEQLTHYRSSNRPYTNIMQPVDFDKQNSIPILKAG